MPLIEIFFIIYGPNSFKDTYILDGCYEQNESTSKLFANEVKPLLKAVLHGDNCCVIAYGVQGSGKTQLIQVCFIDYLDQLCIYAFIYLYKCFFISCALSYY